MVVVIRPRSSTDFDVLLSILHRVHAKSGYPVQGLQEADFLVGDSVEEAWVAEVDGRVVGQVVITSSTATDLCSILWRRRHPDDAIAILGRLFVDPTIQSQGIAAQLVATAVAWAVERRKRLLLFAVKRDEKAARLYEKLGWIQYDEDVFRIADGRQWPAICFASPPSI